MGKEKQVNLTEGPILKSLAQLSIPIMASSFLGTAYNITDMAWIGMLGSKAVAGVGVGGMYVWLSQGLVSLARMGGQVHVAQSCGRGDREDARKYAAGAIWLTIAFGILFALVCVAFTDPLIGFFGLEDGETFGYARIYMKITCGLVIFSYMNLTLTGLFTAQGDSRTPFKANLIGLVMNMILDPLLVLGVGPFPRLEVCGAAIATVTAQILVMAVMLGSLSGAGQEGNVLRKISLLQKIPVQYFQSICQIGIPTALQGTLYCMISMVLTRMVAAFGPEAVATQRVGGQIESISWNTADGFAAALNAFVGQNYGAGKYDRVKRGYSQAIRIAVAWGLLVMAVFLLFPRAMAQVFFHEPKVIGIAVGYLMIIGLSECFLCVEITTIGALSGLGKTKICSIVTILFTGARIPLAMFLGGTSLGITGIWWALTLTSVVKGIVFYFIFREVAKKTLS